MLALFKRSISKLDLRMDIDAKARDCSWLQNDEESCWKIHALWRDLWDIRVIVARILAIAAMYDAIRRRERWPR